MAVEKPENAGAATPQAGEPTPADVTLVGDGRPQADMSPGRPAMPAGEEEEEEDEKKHSAYSILMMSIALMSAIFLVALDVNILGRCSRPRCPFSSPPSTPPPCPGRERHGH